MQTRLTNMATYNNSSMCVCVCVCIQGVSHTAPFVLLVAPSQVTSSSCIVDLFSNVWN